MLQLIDPLVRDQREIFSNFFPHPLQTGFQSKGDDSIISDGSSRRIFDIQNSRRCFVSLSTNRAAFENKRTIKLLTRFVKCLPDAFHATVKWGNIDCAANSGNASVTKVKQMFCRRVTRKCLISHD